MTTLVTGGTGTTGSRVAAGLTEAGIPVRIGSRSAQGRTAARVRFDWTEPGTWADALRGATALYLVPPINDPEPTPVMRAFLEQAHDSGIRRAALLGSSAVPTPPLLDIVTHTVALRPSWFMSNVLGEHTHAVTARERGEIVTATGSGRVAFIDPGDIAAVAVRALTGHPLPDRELVLTGPRALGWDEVADMLTERNGRTVRHRAVTTREMAAHLRAGGVPDAFADLLAALDETIAAGAEDRVTDTVERVTGRAPRDLRAFLGLRPPTD